MEISSILTQNPWWKHGEDFVSFDNSFNILRAQHCQGANYLREGISYFSSSELK